MESGENFRPGRVALTQGKLAVAAEMEWGAGGWMKG